MLLLVLLVLLRVMQRRCCCCCCCCCCYPQNHLRPPLQLHLQGALQEGPAAAAHPLVPHLSHRQQQRRD